MKAREPSSSSAIIAAVVLAIYILSMGPAAAILERFSGNLVTYKQIGHIVSRVYAPLIWTAEHVPGEEAPVARYLKLWVRHDLGDAIWAYLPDGYEHSETSASCTARY
jgi:hypothetical protein